MIEKKIAAIEESALLALKDNEVSEGRTIEYKQSLPGNTRDEKIRFIAGISSFANAVGGDFVIGIVAKKGIPTEIRGLELDNIDEEKLRLEQLIRDGVAPSIPSITIKDIRLSNGKIVFLIRTVQSWISPHRVTLGGHDKFYSRNSAGKYPLDVDELRISFTLSETMKTKIKDFRVERISRILSNDTPVQLVENPKVILHLIPLSSFGRVQSIDLNKASLNPIENLSPIYGRAHDWRYNFDGYLTYRRADGDFRSYVQLYRNGIIEGVEAALIRPGEKNLIIKHITFEEKLIESVIRYLNTLKSLDINPPIFIFLTLLRVRGYTMETRHHQFPYDDETIHKIDKDILSLPEIVIENFDVDIPVLMKLCFDAVWNACGFEKSLNYDENNKRIS